MGNINNYCSCLSDNKEKSNQDIVADSSNPIPHHEIFTQKKKNTSFSKKKPNIEIIDNKNENNNEKKTENENNDKNEIKQNISNNSDQSIEKNTKFKRTYSTNSNIPDNRSNKSNKKDLKSKSSSHSSSS